jgi:hypothetical protein|nr:MAG TPA: hypothetical protein [Caudoviricetes sp.]
MEQTIFNFGTDNTIKELQKAYVKMFIKKINFELTQKNCYLNILPNFYDTCFVCEDWKFKRDLMPDEILDQLIDTLKNHFFKNKEDTDVSDKFVYKYILNEDFKKIFIANLDKINYQLEDENFIFWAGDNDFMKRYLKIMIDYFLKM